jgi:histidyl-tRNA synthetase
VPFAIFIGEDEIAEKKVKIKEMGLPDGHPEKEGILVSTDEMVKEVKVRLQRRQKLEGMTKQAEGLKVVDGVKGGEVDIAKEPAIPEQ